MKNNSSGFEEENVQNAKIWKSKSSECKELKKNSSGFEEENVQICIAVRYNVNNCWCLKKIKAFKEK